MTSRAAELRTKLQTICLSGGEIEQKRFAVVTKNRTRTSTNFRSFPGASEFQDFLQEGLISRSFPGGSNFREFSRSVRTLFHTLPSSGRASTNFMEYDGVVEQFCWAVKHKPKCKN